VEKSDLVYEIFLGASVYLEKGLESVIAFRSWMIHSAAFLFTD